MHVFYALAFTAMLAVTHVAPALKRIVPLLTPDGASCM
jgi:hypothetical protein